MSTNISNDYAWLTPLSQHFLEQDYLLPGQTVDQRVDVICQTAEDILGQKGFAKAFKRNFQKGWYSLSTPIWTNFGTSRGMPISCFGSYIEDNMASILYNQAEVGMMSKYGGGTSAYFGNLRGRGEPIRDNGYSSGSIHFMQLFNTIVSVVSQGSARRGSFAGYLPIDHKDIDEFLTIKSEGSPIQDISFGITVTDRWMEAMIGGDIAKRKVWAKVLETRANVGYPYIIFIDNANNNTADVYKDKSLKINQSNLCVAPETLLTTIEGQKPIQSLAGKIVKIWNGKKWTPALVSKTGVNQRLIRVNFQRGRFLDCTPYHKFYPNGSTTETRAIELKIGDRIETISDRCGEIYESFLEVTSVIDLGRTDDTYCVTEPLEHRAVFNGFLTGNCTEIFLPNNPQESFVCDLSSLNILHYDSWKNTNAVELMVNLLDAVMTEFIDKSEGIAFMERPRRFAQHHRALGIGWLGWHSYLQSKMIPLESMEAKFTNIEIAKTIQTQAYKASQKLAEQYGEPEVLKGYGRRNTTLCAIAPTKSSAFILGQVSEGIEPHRSNYYIKDLAKGKFTIKNPHLENLLEQRSCNTDKVWDNILKNGGSVQQLDFLSEREKNVFKTFAEISPKEIIIQAAQRQKYIDQGQSLNLMIHPSIPAKDVNLLLIEAWKLGIKSLYYQFSINSSQEFAKNILNCISCEA